MIQKYGKALLYVVAALLTTGLATLSTGHIGRVGWVQISIAGTGAVLVYLVPLDPRRGWEKTAVGAILAGEQVLVTLIAGPMTWTGWLQVALGMLTALGVTLAPARSTPPRPPAAVRAGSPR